MNPIWPALLPELKRFPEEERGEALRTARETPLQTLELVAMAAGLVLVTALTKFTSPEASIASRFALALLNFALALPLLVVVLGPLHLRRLRRGLQTQLERRPGP